MMIFTTKGLIERDQLTLKNVEEWGENHRKVLFQYWLGEELVKQSVFVDGLRPLEMAAEHGRLG